MLVPGGEIYERLTYSKPVTDEELALLAKTRLRSLEFAEKPHVAGQLATVYAIQATRAKIAEEQRILWARSVEYAERSLALNPLDGFTWFRYLGRDNPELLAYLAG
jgi:hypothetical protein